MNLGHLRHSKPEMAQPWLQPSLAETPAGPGTPGGGA